MLVVSPFLFYVILHLTVAHSQGAMVLDTVIYNASMESAPP